jgi:hypothetical protein
MLIISGFIQNSQGPKGEALGNFSPGLYTSRVDQRRIQSGPNVGEPGLNHAIGPLSIGKSSCRISDPGALQETSGEDTAPADPFGSDKCTSHCRES